MTGRRLRLADLFCCEGGAANGYVQDGWEVHGFDIVHPDPAKAAKRAPAMRDRYLASGAASFTRTDATELTVDYLNTFDGVRASPPCEDHSATMAFGLADRGTGWMLPHIIARFALLSVPWEIENVESAARHMPGAYRLCGSMFGLGANDSAGRRRTLRRHRLFLTSFPALVPQCSCRGKLIGGVYGHGEQGVNGGRGYGFAADAAREAMGMPWVSRDGCAEAIPPAYGRFWAQLMRASIEAGVRS